MASQAFLAFSESPAILASASGRYVTCRKTLCLGICLSLQLHLPGFSVYHASYRDVRSIFPILYHRLCPIVQLSILDPGLLVFSWALYAVLWPFKLIIFRLIINIYLDDAAKDL